MAQTETAANIAAEARKAAVEKIDFKMVTFSLAGKEYGIDIMSVKEIAKAGRFTYVPNVAPFVRGVYNLRGDIISVIDLRTFFHLPAERKAEDSLESLLILRLGEHVFGVIVDAIDKVIGISAAAIQPPHPIFGDINVKYIKGIVENSGKLYILLDVEKIFAPARSAEAKPAPGAASSTAAAAAADAAAAAATAAEAATMAAAEAGPAGQSRSTDSDMGAGFIREALAALRRFHITTVNDAWFQRRYAEWKAERGLNFQMREQAEAEDFLRGFWSPNSGALWDETFAEAVAKILPPNEAKNINVWNPGCAKGYETWSLAVVLRRRYPESRIKIWANDSDLLAISMAPNMVFPKNLPPYYADFLVEGKNGLSFSQAIRDSVFFEFHDVMNGNSLPPLDLILCQDLLSTLPPVDQNRLLNDFIEKLKANGVLLLGANEMPGPGWSSLSAGGVAAFQKD